MKTLIIALITILITIMAFAYTDPTCTEEKRLKETPETHQRWVDFKSESRCNV